jgi:hypothetical protein
MKRITALAVIGILSSCLPSVADPIEKPGLTNTGPTDPSALKPISGMVITKDGTVLENVRIAGQVTVKANNVTIRNFILDAGGSHYGIQVVAGSTGAKFEHGELINANSALIIGTGFTATALNIHESGADGFKVQGPGGPTVVERCWIHHIGKNPGAHADGNQSIGVNDVTFRYNYFDLPCTAPEPYKENACFILQTKNGPVTNFTIDQNWLNGGGWSLYIPAQAESIRVTNNKFGRDFRFGIMSGRPAEFNGNVWEDNGKPVELGTTKKNMSRD